MARVARGANAAVLGLAAVLVVGFLIVPGPTFSHPPDAQLPAPPSVLWHPTTPVGQSMSSVELQLDGLDPEATGLSWSRSLDPCFSNYTLADSAVGASGPWQTYATFSNQSSNSTIAFEPVEDVTVWWQVGTATCLGTTWSNTLGVTVPLEPALSYRFSSETSVTFSWSNPSAYSDLIKFQSYQMMEHAWNRWFPVPGLSYSELGTTLNGLIPGATYSFQLQTYDGTTGASPLPWYFSSPVVNLSGPSPLVAAAFAHSRNVDVGEATSLSCSATGGVPPYSYGWSFGDGWSATGPTVSHPYSVSGSFAPVCTVQDAASTTSTASSGGIVVAPALVAGAVADRTAAYPGTALVFTGAASGGSGSILGYSWDFGDGSSWESGRTVSHLFATPSDYLVHLVVTDSNGGSAAATAQVSIAELSAHASAGGWIAVPGQPLQFSASAQGGGGPPYSYQWLFGDGAGATGPTPTHAYAVAGSYTPTVIVTDSMGAEISAPAGTIAVGPSAGPGTGAGHSFGLGPTVLGAPILFLAAVVALLVAAGAVLRFRRPPRRRSTPDVRWSW